MWHARSNVPEQGYTYNQPFKCIIMRLIQTLEVIAEWASVDVHMPVLIKSSSSMDGKHKLTHMTSTDSCFDPQ